jgi:5-methylcytosine-specific restriction enzyme subunit McrC
VKSTIPIQNIYYMFCYAWNKFASSKLTEVGGVDSPELIDLFAKVLADSFSRLRRRGLDRGYVQTTDALSMVRGKVNLQNSIILKMRHTQQLACDFDELSADIPTNQILKATIRRVVHTDYLDSELGEKLRNALKYLRDVRDVRLSRQMFRAVQIHRNNSFYDFLMSICELVYLSTIPSEDGEGYQFSDPLRDDAKMALVFQDFVKHFLRIEQSTYRVTPLQLKWDAVASEQNLQMLPAMRTDIHLEKDNDHVIVDTKYYREALQTNYGKSSIHSGHLYQLFSYLKNAEARGAEFANAKGILLYPAVGEKVSFEALVQGHKIQVSTINLDQPWINIRSDLLGLLTN